MKSITRNHVAEWSFVSHKTYSDPFNDVDLSVLFTGEDGTEQLVPAFWAGDSTWKVRFSSPKCGKYTYLGVCSDIANPDLHACKGDLTVIPYSGDNALLRHGRIQAAPDRRHFQHSDGVPFFWLGDTWWMGLCKRLSWPDEFNTLAEDRGRKGFNIIQIVAGLYPDMPAFDERGANEGGFPWEEDYKTINPAYFDMADRRISHLVDVGLVPCIVGCWGYFIKFMGIEKMKQHWRYLIARYGAYPVVWCLAGEGSMPYYLSEDKHGDSAFQKEGWTLLTKYVRGIDPYNSIVSVHPTDSSRNQITDPSIIDFDMLQTGHSDRECLPPTVEAVIEAYDREPRMPVINSEVCYEGIGEACRQEVQRLMFWSCVLSGAAGHTYGANGIWQVNTREKPYGPSPHGMSWGNVPWEDAYKLPGSANLSVAKKLLERFKWWLFEPHPEWVDRRWSKENYAGTYAAGIPGQVRVVFFPLSCYQGGTIKGVEKDVNYNAYLFNPVDGSEVQLGFVAPNEKGDWELPVGNPPWKLMPIFQDWILVMEAK